MFYLCWTWPEGSALVLGTPMTARFFFSYFKSSCQFWRPVSHSNCLYGRAVITT